jgi:PKD repeat protein
MSICYNAPGSYDVTLVATGVSGMDSVTLTNYVTVYPFPPPQGIIQSGDTLYAIQGSNSYQWFHNGIIIPGATDYFYALSEGGNYNVVCTDGNGCEVEAVINDVIAGISQLANGNWKLEIFPNPASDILSIKGKQLSGSRIKIYNETGEEIFVEIIKSKNDFIREINIQTLPKGIYVIAIERGENVFRSTFVKQ